MLNKGVTMKHGRQASMAYNGHGAMGDFSYIFALIVLEFLFLFMPVVLPVLFSFVGWLVLISMLMTTTVTLLVTNMLK